MNNTSVKDLMTMWTQLLVDAPTEGQFIVWAELYPVATIRHAFAKTGQKNFSDPDFFENLDHKVRFAAKCMQASVNQKAAGRNERSDERSRS